MCPSGTTCLPADCCFSPDNCLADFPHLDETELRNNTCGIYQLKLSSSYMQEYLEGNSEIIVHQEDDHLIRCRLQSRHTSSRTYLLWIEYSPTQVTAWYYKCRAGARVVGVCSHIASIVAGTEFELVNPTCIVTQLSLVEMWKVS
jgi:uncharacterized protein YdaL